MSGNQAVKCLVCSSNLVVRDISAHAHLHIQYYPYKCYDCDHGTINSSDMDVHMLDTEHKGGLSVDPYKQWLVETLKEDCLFAAKHGVKKLMERKRATAASTPSTPTTTSSEARQRPPQPSPQRPHCRAVTSPSPQLEESSSDEEQEPPRVAARPPAPAATRRSNDNVPPRQSEPMQQQADSDDGDSEDEKIAELRKSLKSHVKCEKCNATVPITLAARQAHIREKHMDNLRNGPSEAQRRAFQEELESRTKQSFPAGLVWNNTQCRLCPKHKSIQSYAGRKSHVVAFHNSLIKDVLYCPLCNWSDMDPSSFKKHFEDTHTFLSKWRQSVEGLAGRKGRDFLEKYDKQVRKIDTIKNLIFTMDFSPVTDDSNKRKKRKSGAADDDDDEVFDVAAMLAAAPSRPTGNRSAPKRRLPTPTPSSSDNDSDEDDESANSKKKALAAKRRASDKEEGGETNEEEGEKGEEMDQGSMHGSSCATVATNNSSRTGQEEVKHESALEAPEVKNEEEIKQERPETPTSTPHPALRQFTGRVKGPAPGPSPFPSQQRAMEERLAVRREQQQQQHRGRGPMRGRGGPRGPRGRGSPMGGGAVGRGRAGFNNSPRGGYGGGRGGGGGIRPQQRFY